MVSIDELSATIKRMDIILNNVEDPSDRFVAYNIRESLAGLSKQLEVLTHNPNFPKIVEEWDKQK